MQVRNGGRHLRTAGLIGVALLATGAWADDHAVSVPLADAHDHVQASGDAAVRRTVTQLLIPDVTLVRDDGKRVNLPAELNDGRPVFINFIYTSCTTICPLTSQIFEQLQEERSAPGKPWVRFDGFARADDLMAERKQWEASARSLVAR